ARMPAETEELRLSVTLDDQASAQLERIRRQVGELGGDGPQGIGQLRRQAAATTIGVKGLSAEIQAFASRAGFIGGVVGGVTSELVKMGVELAARATDFKSYAEGIVRLSQSAQALATSNAQMRA